MSTLLAATRPTRRDILRHPWRILAAVLLIALPVFAGSWILATEHSASTVMTGPTIRTSAELGGDTCRQSIDRSRHDCEGDVRPGSALDLLEAHLPEGFEAELHYTSWGSASTEHRQSTLNIRQRPTGALPPADEIYLPSSAAAALQVEAGDTFTYTPDSSELASVELTVAGISPGFDALVSEPTLLAPTDSPESAEETYRSTWVITGPREFTWDDVLALNAVGFTVRAEDVIDNPPPADAVPEGYRTVHHPATVTSDAMTLFLMMVAALVVGVLFLLVISPVFTIATTRMSRIFALMSSQGATPGHIRLAVLAYGLLAGVIGATIGAVLGVGAHAIWWMFTYPGWPQAVPWGYVALLWLLAVVASTAAAMLPAWVVSRASISAGVQGAAPDRLLQWRPWMAIGPVGLALLAGGMLVAWLTVDHDVLTYYGPLPALAMVVLLAASAPALVWVMGRAGRKAPVAWRLALRDAGRQSLRSVPALAALMAVLAVSVGIITGAQAARERSQDLFESVYENEAILITPEGRGEHRPQEEDVKDVITHIQSITGPAERTTLRGVHPNWHGDNFYEINYGQLCGPGNQSEQCALLERSDRVSGPLEWASGSYLEASPEMLDLLRIDEPVDLSTPAVLVPRDFTVDELTLQHNAYSEGQDPEVLDEVTLPTLPVLPELMVATLITPAGLAELGAPVDYVGTILTPAEKITFTERRDIAAWVKEETVGTSVNVLPPNNRPDWWTAAAAGILGLGVLVVVTLVLALSWQGSRRQFALIDAIGAPPSLPSRVSGAFAALLALAGSLAGVVSGYLAAWFMSTRTVVHPTGVVMETGAAGYLAPDWWLLLVLLVLTPVAAWAVGSLFHRRLGELEYRET
ncbi:MAG: hypothetical protein Q4G50_06650 [Corynebacterium sp.]|uniref:FtsX-like permease family protein n=1 Tax=Corynebacterium sp. TaxID=1720 RepID=UPI0026DFBE37|nr:FtsX-like permease family protein [Corynebacterium sp.]MDO5669665.1 hypothetical protein [Corynebacterium sp.]